MLSVPVYVVTGFLEAGKTRLLNQLLSPNNNVEVQRLVIQFEAGLEELSDEVNCDLMMVPKRVLDQEPQKIALQLQQYLEENSPEEIWVEWNGVTPLTALYEILADRNLVDLCRLQKIIHMADAHVLEQLVGKTGAALPEQISSCDFAVLRGAFSQQDFRRLRRLIRELNPGVTVLQDNEPAAILQKITSKKRSPITIFSGAILLAAAAYLGAESVFHLSQTPVNTLINIFLGIMLQAIPFLLIGVLISSVIQVLIPRQFIERRFPKNLVGGMITAILAGFCLPVCDCASIPIFRSLVKKGVPLPAAVTFMTATPVINPVVMLSTYYAFNGSLSIVFARVAMGILAAVLIGLWFALRPSNAAVFSSGFDGVMCSCGCYEGVENVTSPLEKLGLVLRHSQAEFFQVAKYLTIGAFLASVFQLAVTNTLMLQTHTDFAVSLLLMMALAFLLSLCSSSDAIVARSFAARFPIEPIMGFLVFGPMMDIKNVMLLSGSFSKRFVAKLLAVCFIVCFAVVFFAAGFLTGGV